MPFSLESIQTALRSLQLDGWLLYDFRGGNPLARQVLQLDDKPPGSRRIAYGIPVDGPPLKLVHRIEDAALDHLPGERTIYLRWQEFELALAGFLKGRRRMAMEYSPGGGNPYLSRVDAGTVELVRSLGPEVVSSGDLVQLFDAVWTEDQWAMHLQAAEITNSAFEVAWRLIADRVRQGGGVVETEVQAAIMAHFHAHGATTYHPPIVARGPHSGQPHYETGAGADCLIREGDFVLIDLWAKLDQPRAVYSDLTRVGYVGKVVPDQFSKVFRIVADARDAGIELLQQAAADGQSLQGAEVDRAVRAVIEKAGYGPKFTHRTGHNLGQEVHGNGAHLDHLETREERSLLPGTCFTIEPGIYLDDFGVRSEVNVYLDAKRRVEVTGGEVQTEVLPILSRY